MAYNPQKFEDGQVLEAEHLNNIEAGIVAVENEVAGKQPKGEYITNEADPTVPAWAKQERKPTYTAEEVGARPDSWTPSAADVGADPAGTAASEVSEHNTNDAAHNDIRLLLSEVKASLEAFLDTDEETMNELSELITAINDNKTSVEALTSGKVNVADIINNLTTNVTNKPISAAQGVALKALIDALQKLYDNHIADGTAHITAAERTAWNNKQPTGDYVTNEALTAEGYAKAADVTKHTGDTTVHVTDEEKESWNGKLGQDDLSGAVDDALAAAKASGEFDGEDGTSVTVKSVSESSEDDGENVVTFSDGKTLKVKNGSAGGDGTTPVKGIDYYTEADKAEMVQQVLAAIPVITEMSVDMSAEGVE